MLGGRHGIASGACLAALSSGCFSATPVVAAPASDAEVAEIRASLTARGWASARFREEGGAFRDDAQPTEFVFTAERATINPGGGYALCDQCSYVVEGRNVRVRHPNGTFLTFRVDVHAPDHVELFWYDLSRHFDLYPVKVPTTANGGAFAASTKFTPKPRTPGDVALHFKGEPPPACGRTDVGVVTYDGNAPDLLRFDSATDAVALEGLRTYLASLGADGATHVRCGGAETVGAGICAGVAFVCDPGATPTPTPAPPTVDRVFLKSGEVVAGTIVGEDARAISIMLEDGHGKAIPVADVDRIERAPRAKVPAK